MRHFIFAAFSEPGEIELPLLKGHIAVFQRCHYLLSRNTFCVAQFDVIFNFSLCNRAPCKPFLEALNLPKIFLCRRWALSFQFGEPITSDLN